jgi:hypothetical protein
MGLMPDEGRVKKADAHLKEMKEKRRMVIETTY